VNQHCSLRSIKKISRARNGNARVRLGRSGDAGADQRLVADKPEGKADQDRRGDREPRPYVAFQMAEIAIPRNLFAEILRLIAELRPPLAASTA
jgi:hypothetical protein